MICFNCGYKFESSYIKKCLLCGMETPFTCISCGSPNPSMARFCFHCGTQIEREDPSGSIQNYDILPENRKNVAVIFADISGFTALSEKLDPEEVREIINDCFNFVTGPVYELEGSIDKYIGDCVMVLFGARLTHGDDPRRAVECALKMMDKMDDFSKERLEYKGLTLSMSIGINYGLVVTGRVGNYFDKDYTVMGDTVNTAQRLQTAAGKGTILVSESVYEETKGSFYYSTVQSLSVKNKEKPLCCYSPYASKFHSADEGLLVNRDSELKLMLSACHKSKDIEYTLITGEHGIGKTSIMKAFASKLPENTKKVWFDCSQMLQNRIHYVVSNLLYNVMNINLEDSNNAKKYRLLSFIYYILRDHSEDEIQKNFNFLGILMGLEKDQDFQNVLNSMKHSDIEREIAWQLAIFFRGLDQTSPYAFFIDDIQWADPVSMDLLYELRRHLPGARILFVFSSQLNTSTQPTTAYKPTCTIKLNALDFEGIKLLSCKLLECSSIDNSLLDSIHKVTGGNPLYVKEYVLLLRRKECCILRNGTAFLQDIKSASVSNTIEGVILSNLSKHAGAAMHVLQAASVIGREFSLSWVKNLVGTHQDVEETLLLFVQLHIISLKSTRALPGRIEKTYIFNQDIAKSAIYHSILVRERIELHKKIGEFIETKFSNELENYYEILCMHFQKAGLAKKTSEYYFKTGMKNKNNYYFDIALKYFTEFLEMNLENPKDSDKKEVSQAFASIGYIYSVKSNYDLALQHLNMALLTATLSDDMYTVKLMTIEIYREQGLYNKALELINEMELKLRPGTSLYGQLLQQKCTILRLNGDPSALLTAEKSEQVLLKTRDYTNLSETMRQAAFIHFTKGDMDNALFYLNKAYNYAKKVNNPRSMANISRNLGIIYHSSGLISKALEFLTKSLELSEKISDIQGGISGNINLGILYMERGLFNRAEVLLNQALDDSQRLSLVYQTCAAFLNLGDLLYERGDYQKSHAYHTKAYELSLKYNLMNEEGASYLRFARLYLNNASLKEIPEMLEKAYAVFTKCNEMSYMSDYYKYKSRFELTVGNLPGAMDFCEKALSIANEVKSDMKKLKLLRLKGDIQVMQKEYANSVALYDQAVILAEQLESDYEAAIGYYKKSVVLTYLNASAAEQSLLKAREFIRKTDPCKWTEVISPGLE